ncbi:hypothetical protein ACFL4G_04495 [Thermodesulfobacteriota bacterium]
MVEEDFRRRAVNPLLPVLAAASLSFVGYFGSRHLESHDFLQQIMAGVFGTTCFLSVALGPIYIYTTAYLRGAGMLERLAAIFIVPFLWMTKETLLLTESHPLLECLYWYFNPLNIWLVFLVIFQAGVGTMVARRIMKSRGEGVRVVTTGPVVTSVVSLFLIVALFAWGKGENVYTLFLEGYRFFFGSGV